MSRNGKAPCLECACFSWFLGESLPMELDKIDAAVHLAHDFNGAEAAERTFNGTLKLIEEVRNHGAARQVFYSSYSAGSHAASLYGKTKLRIENAVKDAKDVIIIRPGLVLGESGLYGRISKFAGIFPIIPLPDGGKQKMPIIEVHRLCDDTISILTANSPPKELNLFEPQITTLKDIVLKAVPPDKTPPFILPFPSWLLHCVLALCEKLKIPLPVTSDNLKGLLANASAIHKSSYDIENRHEK